MKPRETYIEAGYRPTSGGHKSIDGVRFISHRIGIMQSARISEDGQIMTQPRRNFGSYMAAVIGVGTLKNKAGNIKRFRTEDAAAREAVKVWRRLKATAP